MKKVPGNLVSLVIEKESSLAGNTVSLFAMPRAPHIKIPKKRAILIAKLVIPFAELSACVRWYNTRIDRLLEKNIILSKIVHFLNFAEFDNK